MLARACARLIDTPSIFVKEVVLDNDTSDTVCKTQLWLIVSIKIFIKKWYMYTFIKVFFKTNLCIYFLHFQTQQSTTWDYLWFIFPRFDLNVVLNDLLCEYGGSKLQPNVWCLYVYKLFLYTFLTHVQFVCLHFTLQQIWPISLDPYVFTSWPLVVQNEILWLLQPISGISQ